MKLRRLSLMEWKKVVLLTVFVSMITIQIFNVHNNLLGNLVDDGYYQNVTRRAINIGTVQGLFDSLKNDFEIKSVPFMALQVVFRAYDTLIYTRALNIVLILVVTGLIYDMSKRKEALLFPIIPWFLNGMFLTNEIIEVVIVLFSIKFSKHSGILIGIATLFRPYAIVYTALLKRSQIKYVLGLGLMYVLILLYYDSFTYYLFRVLNYSVVQRLGSSNIDYVSLLFLPLMIFLGYKTKMFWYGTLAMIPLTSRMFSHYFIPCFVFFLLGYLLQLKENRVIGNKI